MNSSSVSCQCRCNGTVAVKPAYCDAHLLWLGNPLPRPTPEPKKGVLLH